MTGGGIMALDFTGQSALILGGEDGVLASEIADRLRSQGAAVALRAAADIVAQEVDGTVDMLVTVLEAPQDDVLGGFGEGALEAYLDRELAGATRAIGTVVAAMRKAGRGRIVCCVPSSAMFGAHRGVAQSIAGAGIAALARSIAIGNLDRGIRANIVSYVAALPATETLFADHPVLDRSLFEVASVLPIVTYLASDGCRLNGETISAGAGRFAKLFTAITLGGFDPAIQDDAIDALMPRIMDTRSTLSPRTVEDELITVVV